MTARQQRAQIRAITRKLEGRKLEPGCREEIIVFRLSSYAIFLVVEMLENWKIDHYFTKHITALPGLHEGYYSLFCFLEDANDVRLLIRQSGSIVEVRPITSVSNGSNEELTMTKILNCVCEHPYQGMQQKIMEDK